MPRQAFVQRGRIAHVADADLHVIAEEIPRLAPGFAPGPARSLHAPPNPGSDAVPMNPVAPVMRICEDMEMRHSIGEHPLMAKELIFIADDFGMNREINDAILHAHLSGHLTGAALMMAQPATDDAVALARAHPTLQIGWHLHLNDSVPATTDRWPWGARRRGRDSASAFPPKRAN